MTYFANISDTIFSKLSNNVCADKYFPTCSKQSKYVGKIYCWMCGKYCVGYVGKICHVDILAKRILGAFLMLKSSNGSLAKTRNNAWQQRIQSGPRCGFVIASMVVSAESRRDKVFNFFQDPNVSRMSCKYIMFMRLTGEWRQKGATKLKTLPATGQSRSRARILACMCMRPRRMAGVHILSEDCFM